MKMNIGLKFYCLLLSNFLILTQANAVECNLKLTVKDIFLADQADLQLPIEKKDEVIKNRRMRQKYIADLVECGAMKNEYDWYRASIIMSHGESINDIASSLQYAKRALVLDPEFDPAKNMMANAWDKLMLKLNRKQWFGTQFNDSGYLPIEKCLITREERVAAGVNIKIIEEQDSICKEKPKDVK